MLLIERELDIPLSNKEDSVISYFENKLQNCLDTDEVPVRFVITGSRDKKYHCEVGVITKADNLPINKPQSIFNFLPRKCESTDTFNSVLLIPTGIGAEIGGHSGDGGSVAKLLASACDTFITHPNVVNASDINELPENGLYIEGSVISRLLMGTVGLQKVRSNRVLLVIDKHEDELFVESAINSASAARATYGFNCPRVVVMEDKILMRSLYASSGRAVGTIDYIERLFEILTKYRSEYDAVALSSTIKVPKNFHKDYFSTEYMVNPWGGFEAMLTHTVSMLYNVPSAHSPMMESREILDLEIGVVDPRKSAEGVSVTFLNCILKGLHKSPKIITEPTAFTHPGVITVADIDCLVIPDGCVGLPTLAALEQGITVIAVKENKNTMKNDLSTLPFKPGKLIYADNYLEAVGVMTTIKAGVTTESVRRPLSNTNFNQESYSSSNHLINNGESQKISNSDLTVHAGNTRRPC